MPSVRTMVVLGSLVVMMSLTSVLLAVLQPSGGERRRAVQVVSGQGLEVAGSLTESEVPLREGHWRQIVIRFSGSDRGSAHWLGRRHEAVGRGGLGYHFVINNGSFRPDGVVEVGYRWRRQQPAAWSDRPADQPHRTVAICLVGEGHRYGPSAKQMDQLLRLVRHLQNRLNISDEAVRFDAHTARGQLATLFPEDEFRRELFASASR